jgi:hypothetical protein
LVTGPEQYDDGAYRMGGGPYNKITCVKSLADMVGEEGDKSGFFEPTMTTMPIRTRKSGSGHGSCTHDLMILKSGKGTLKIYGGED